MIQFCNRQPDACAAGAQFASAFGQRAEAGAKMLYEIVGEKLAKANGACRCRRHHGRPLAEHLDVGRPRAGLARPAPQGLDLNADFSDRFILKFKDFGALSDST